MRTLSFPVLGFVAVLLMNYAAVTTRAQQDLRVMQAVAPMYPPIAASAGASGTVIIEVAVDSRGNVTSVRLVDGLPLLGKAAEESARRWVFAPNVQTVTKHLRLTFTFRLMPADATPQESVVVFVPPYHVEVRRVAPKVVDNPNVDPPVSRPRVRKRRH